MSYEGDGLGIAYGVVAALVGQGIGAWMWHLHHQSGIETFEEMAAEVKEADKVIIICTSGTKSCPAQPRRTQ